jgi:hypothetical protein
MISWLAKDIGTLGSWFTTAAPLKFLPTLVSCDAKPTPNRPKEISVQMLSAIVSLPIDYSGVTDCDYIGNMFAMG